MCDRNAVRVGSGAPVSTIELAVGATRLAIELDTANAPGLSAAMLRAAPHETLAVHCATAGAEFCVPVPFFHWHENRRPPAPGDVGYASFGNYLCFYYGPMSAVDGPTNVIGRLLSPASELDAIGHALLLGGAQRAVVRNLEPASAAALPPMPDRGLPPRADASEFEQLARTLLAAALDNPPADISRLRDATLPAMGNLAGRMQASMLLLAVAEVLMNARSSAVMAPHALTPIVASLAAQLERYARWLAMAGMEGTAGWLSRVAPALRTQPLRVEHLIAGLEDALIAFGRLRFWAEAISPWHRLPADIGSDQSWLEPSLWKSFR